MKFSKKKIIFILFLLILVTYIIYIFMPYKRLSITLGEDVTETQKHSTYDLKLDKHKPRKEPKLYAVSETSSILEYRDPKLGFSLPPTILTTFMTIDRKVYDIETHPQLKLLNLKNAKDLLNQMKDLFERSGWQKDSNYQPPDLSSMTLERFEDNPSHSKLIGIWKNGHKEIILTIKRQLTKKEIEEHPLWYYAYSKYPYQDHFLIIVKIYQPYTDWEAKQ